MYRGRGFPLAPSSHFYRHGTFSNNSARKLIGEILYRKKKRKKNEYIIVCTPPVNWVTVFSICVVRVFISGVDRQTWILSNIV